jgi:dethiobiotin synthetase
MVIGVGTGVGKTHVAVALVGALVRQGLAVCGVKPIESGISHEATSDADRLAEVSSHRAAGEPPYRFRDPVSPHLAARRAGVAISVEVAARWIRQQTGRIVVVETAGALLSPLGVALTNLDLVRGLRPDSLVLVGLDRLGVLHEMAACLVVLSALASELPAPVVVLNEPPAPDASTGTNGAELIALGVSRDVTVLPRAEPLAASSQRGVESVLRALGL